MLSAYLQFVACLGVAIACVLGSRARAQAPDVVYLRDGSRLRGTWAEYRPSTGGTLVTSTGERILDGGEVLRTVHLDQPGLEPSPALRVRVHFTASDGSPLTFYRVTGAVSNVPDAVRRDRSGVVDLGISPAPINPRPRWYVGNYLVAERICTAPCERMVPAGTIDVAVAYGAETPVLAGTLEMTVGAIVRGRWEGGPRVTVVRDPLYRGVVPPRRADAVTLRDGTLLYGVLESWRSGSGGVLVGRAGQRMVLAPGSVERTEFADLVGHGELDDPLEEQVEVQIETAGPRLSVFRETGAYIPMLPGRVSSRSIYDSSRWTEVCRAPCRATLPRDRLLLALRGDGERLRFAAPNLVDLHDSRRIFVGLERHDDARVAGVGVTVGGVLAGLALTVGSVGALPDEVDVFAGVLTAGLTTVVAALLAGVGLMAWNDAVTVVAR